MKYILLVTFYCCLTVQAQITITWQKKSSLPSFSREDFGAFLIDSDYCVVGGIDELGNPISEVWRYSIPTDHWQRMNDFPGGPIGEHQCFAINGKGYLLTGIDSIGGYECDSDFWQYDPHSDTWTQKASFPGGRREGGTSFSFAGNGYFAFGIHCNVRYANDVWKYEPIADRWSLLLDTLPALGRYGCINTVVDTFVYFIGGLPEMSNTMFSDMWRYNIGDHSWTSLNFMPGKGRELSMLYGFGNFLIAGYGAYEFGNLSDCYRYNYSNQIWSPVIVQNFPDSIAGVQNSCFQYKNTIYFFAGFKDNNFSFYNDLWAFDATPLLTTGIEEPKAEVPLLSIHPNPVSSHGTLTISSQQSGEVQFYNSIGQLLYTSHLDEDSNEFSCDQLHYGGGVVIYRAALRDGSIENGRVVVY